MIFNSFITQIGMIVLAVGITFFYIKPTFNNIGNIQEAIGKYQTEREKVTGVNETLANLVSRVNGISAADMKALYIYIPDSINDVAVSRDILTIAKASGVYLDSVDYGEVVPTKAEDITQDYKPPVKYSFTASVLGTYEQVKLFFSLLEQNNYPLEVHNLDISATEAGLIKAEMRIITYSHI